MAGADPDPYHTRARELLDVYQIPTIPYLGNALQPLCWAPGQAPLSPRAAGEDHGMWTALIDHVFLSAQQSLYRLPTAQREPSLDVFNQVQFALKRFVDVVRHERVQIAMAHFMRQQGRQPSLELMPEPKSEAREEVDMGVVERQIMEKEVHRQRRLANQDREIERGRARADRATKKGANQQEPIIRELPTANGPDPGASTARVRSAQLVKSGRGKGATKNVHVRMRSVGVDVNVDVCARKGSWTASRFAARAFQRRERRRGKGGKKRCARGNA